MAGSDKKLRVTTLARQNVPDGLLAAQVKTSDIAAEDYYMDPKTGFMVFTERYLLKRGFCCDSGCRHCPYPKSEL